jgi:hypothetical protein
MLKFNPAWRFQSPGPLPLTMAHALSDMIGRIATQGDRWRVLEHFKGHFATAVGVSAAYSTSESWAETDLDRYLGRAAENAPLCIEAFVDGCSTLAAQNPSITVPDLALINQGSYRVSGWRASVLATKPAMRVPRSALPRRRALWTSWKKPR